MTRLPNTKYKQNKMPCRSSSDGQGDGRGRGRVLGQVGGGEAAQGVGPVVQLQPRRRRVAVHRAHRPSRPARRADRTRPSTSVRSLSK